MDYVAGGQLLRHMRKHTMLSEDGNRRHNFCIQIHSCGSFSLSIEIYGELLNTVFPFLLVDRRSILRG